jgi:hypothetical protein
MDQYSVGDVGAELALLAPGRGPGGPLAAYYWPEAVCQIYVPTESKQHMQYVCLTSRYRLATLGRQPLP